MPIEWVSAGLLLSAGFSLTIIGLELQVLIGHLWANTISILLIGIVSAFFAIRWNIFNIGEVAGKLMGKLSRA